MGDIQLEVRLDAPSSAELRVPVPAGWNRWLAADVRDRRIVGGSRGDLPMGVFRVRNPGRRAVRLSAINLPEDSRSRRVIEPAAGHEARLLEPGETVAIRVGFPAPDPWTVERPMLDRYLLPRDHGAVRRLDALVRGRVAWRRASAAGRSAPSPSALCDARVGSGRPRSVGARRLGDRRARIEAALYGTQHRSAAEVGRPVRRTAECASLCAERCWWRRFRAA